MKTKLHKIAIRMSKLGIYVMIVCQSLQMALATETEAQRKYLEEIGVELSKTTGHITLIDLFREIESKTDFKFAYSKIEIKSKSVVLDGRYWQMDDVLSEISTQARVSFKRVNESIGVSLANKSQNLPDVVERIVAQATVSGTVTDENGDPLPGATVTVKGTSKGTVTDVKGNYRLEVDENAVLIVSFVGFKTQEIMVNDRSTIDVQLTYDDQALEGVVVIGYGTQDKSSITGSVASISSKDLEAFPSSSVEQSLAGKLSGVQLSQSSGQPGAGISIRVRGISSISGGNEPLYVVDGVPFFNSDVRGLNGISAINPNDIQSIEVLKDASATAIYGSRGANGVVIITTKSGKANESSVSYNTWVSLRNVRKKLDLMTGSEFLDYQDQFFTNSGQTVPDDVQQIQNANTDWQDEVFRTGVATNHDLNFSGGSEKSQYYISIGYLNEQGIVSNSDFERISARVNLNSNLTDGLTLKSFITASNSVQNGFSPADNNNTFSFITSGIGSTLLALPTEPVKNADGDFSMIFPYDFAAQLENPVGYAANALDQTTVNRFLGNITLKAKIFDGFYNNTRVGADFQSRRNDLYFPTSFELVLGGNGAALLNTNEKLNYVAENYFDFSVEAFDDFVVNAVLGVSLQRESSKFINLQSTGFFSDELESNAIQAGSSFSTPLTNNIDQSIASAFGRVNAAYQDKYLFSASIRRDGASVFSESNKTATFPALSAGWKISEEDFLQDNANISSLKFRVSWGKSGNPGIQPYQSLPLGQIVISSQGSGSGLSTGLAPNLPNRNLTWETTTQTNIGLDAELFNARINVAVDYYVKNTEDALASVQLPPSGGFSSIIDNIGEVQNEGIELVIGANLIQTRDLQWDVNFNISNNKNTVLKTKDGQDIISELSFAQTANADGGVASVIREGEQLGAFLGFNFTGLDEAGVPQYEDLDNNGVIDADDMQVIGSPIPEVLYGLSTSLTYKNFALAMNWQGQSSVEVLNLGALNLTSPENGYNRLANIYDYYPNPNQNLLHRVSQRYVEDASFLRLRNIRVGYNIPLSNFFIDNLNVYLSGQNLITITDYSGFDPDVNSLSGNTINQGIDLAAYPSSKAYTLGLNVKF